MCSLTNVVPKYWQEFGDSNNVEARKIDLENAFGKLQPDLKVIWPDASFQVYKAKQGKYDTKGPRRWVDIDPERLQVIEPN